MQEAEQLAIYFEEVSYAEKKKMRESQGSGATSSYGDWQVLGNDHEEYAFEDPEFWPQEEMSTYE